MASIAFRRIFAVPKERRVMQTAKHPSAATLAHWEKKAPAFSSLAGETRAAVDTATAAYHLNRQPQTLRCWAALQSGPLRPLRINGRLAWKTEDLRRVLGVAQ